MEINGYLQVGQTVRGVSAGSPPVLQCNLDASHAV